MCKLIMIDDNPIEHLILQKIFDNYEIFPEAVHATNAQLIIDFLSEHSLETAELPDMLLLDLHMPGCDGFDFMEQFQHLAGSFRKPINIYVLSSSVDLEDRLRALSYPFVREFLTKPVMKEKLVELYNTFLENERKIA